MPVCSPLRPSGSAHLSNVCSTKLLSEKLPSLHTPSTIYVVFNYSFFSQSDAFIFFSLYLFLVILLFFLSVYQCKGIHFISSALSSLYRKIKAANFFLFVLQFYVRWDERLNSLHVMHLGKKIEKNTHTHTRMQQQQRHREELLVYVFGLNAVSNGSVALTKLCKFKNDSKRLSGK